MIWWAEKPARSKREHAAVEELASSVDWLDLGTHRLDGTKLCWDVDIRTPNHTYPLTLRYPDHFPHSPALVLPRGSRERWSSHQYGAGGELCLEFGPDNWHPDLTGADLLSSAYRLLTGEEAHDMGSPDVESRHQESLGQILRFASKRLLITEDGDAPLSNLPIGAQATGTALVLYREKKRVYILDSLNLAGNEWQANLPALLRGSTYRRPVLSVRIAAETVLPSAEDQEAFRSQWRLMGVDLEGIELLIVVQGTHVVAFDLFFDGTITLPRIVLARSPENRLDEPHAKLATRKVGIVGCGSIGSKVAATLARSGVGSFVLVDDDLLFPENLVRNDLDWRDIGMHKVDAVADKIGAVNTRAECKRFKRILGGQESSTAIETLLSVLATCDLLIDTTANPNSFNYLCSVCSFGKIPLAWAELFGGGFGGFVARSRPGHDPDPATMRLQILQWCRERGRVIDPSPGKYLGTPDAPEIGDDAEVSAIAAHLSMLAVDLLIPRDPSAYPNSVYMIGFRAGWIFDYPFDTHPIDVGTPLPNVENEATEGEIQAELERILQLLEKPNASPNPD